MRAARAGRDESWPNRAIARLLRLLGYHLAPFWTLGRVMSSMQRVCHTTRWKNFKPVQLKTNFWCIEWADEWVLQNRTGVFSSCWGDAGVCACPNILLSPWKVIGLILFYCKWTENWLGCLGCRRQPLVVVIWKFVLPPHTMSRIVSGLQLGQSTFSRILRVACWYH